MAMSTRLVILTIFAAGTLFGVLLSGLYSFEGHRIALGIWRINHVTGSVSYCTLDRPDELDNGAQRFVVCASD